MTKYEHKFDPEWPHGHTILDPYEPVAVAQNPVPSLRDRYPWVAWGKKGSTAASFTNEGWLLSNKMGPRLVNIPKFTPDNPDGYDFINADGNILNVMGIEGDEAIIKGTLYTFGTRIDPKTGRSLSFGVLHVGGNVDIEQEYLDAAAEAMNRVAYERVARGEKP